MRGDTVGDPLRRTKRAERCGRTAQRLRACGDASRRDGRDRSDTGDDGVGASPRAPRAARREPHDTFVQRLRRMTRFDVVALDADDTLWHNETLFTATQTQFRNLLARYH